MRSILALLVIFFSSCSDDDSLKSTFTDVVGVVEGPTSCGGDNGSAYQIAVSILDDTDFIITGTLPEQFKEQNTRIKFDMNPSMDGISECTTNFTEMVFYRVSNVKLSQ